MTAPINLINSSHNLSASTKGNCSVFCHKMPPFMINLKLANKYWRVVLHIYSAELIPQLEIQPELEHRRPGKSRGTVLAFPCPLFWTLSTYFGDKVTALIFKQSARDGIGSLGYYHHTRAWKFLICFLLF